jgi:hypothetical protein
MTATPETVLSLMTEMHVTNGARLLDELEPGWYAEIDLARLTMSDCEDCVLGQLFGGYGDGLKHLGLTDESGTTYGFDEIHDIEDYLPAPPSDDFEFIQWEALRSLWINEINTRCEKAGERQDELAMR